MPGVDDVPRVLVGDGRAVEQHRAAHHRNQPEQRVGELGLAVALNPRDAEHLPLGDVEAEVVDDDRTARVGDDEVGHPQSGVPSLSGRLVDPHAHRPAHHHLGQMGLRVAGGRRADHPAAPDDGDVVGDLTHLAELVGDEHDRPALVAQGAHDGHEVVDLLRA